MSITTEDENKPLAPEDMTEQAESTPVAPQDATEVAESTPAAPQNATEVSESSPAAPQNATEVNESTPAAPSDLTEVSESSPSAPSNITEVNESTPVAPSNMTEVSQSALAVPQSMTVAADQVARTLLPALQLGFESETYSSKGQAVSLDSIGTYARASSGTYVDKITTASGRAQYIIKEQFVGTVTELLQFNADFDQWSKSNASVAYFGEKTPDGVKAYRVYGNTNNTSHFISQSMSFANNQWYTFSARVKAKSYRKLRMSFSTEAFPEGSRAVIFDLKSAIPTAPDLSVASSIVHEGDDWYLCSITAKTDAAATAIAAIQVIDDAGNATFAADPSDYFLAGQASVTQSRKVIPWHERLSNTAQVTYTASPRISYDPNSGRKGYLVETATTNIWSESELYGGAEWVLVRAAAVDFYAKAPDGTYTAALLRDDSTSTQSHYISKTLPLTDGADYTASVFVKAQGTQRVALDYGGAVQARVVCDIDDMNFTFTGGSGLLSYGVEDYGDGWKRLHMTFLANSSGSSVVLYLSDGADNNLVFNGTQSNSVLIWGMQLETSLVLTSYVRTESSNVSRSTDFLSMPFEFNQGTIAIEGNYFSGSSLNPNARHALELSQNRSADNRIIVYNGSSQNNVCFMRAYAESGLVLNSNADENGYGKSVISIGKTMQSIYVNGVIYDTENNKVPDAIDELFIGCSRTEGGQLGGIITDIRIYNEVATDAEAKTL